MDSIMFRSLAHSNIPHREKKSIIRHWFDSLGDSPSHRSRAAATLHHSAHGVRQGGEALFTGAVLGAVHAESGLDIKGKVPADLLLGIAGIAGASAMSHEEYATDLRNIGATGFATFGFRQGYAFVAEKKRAKGGIPTAFNVISLKGGMTAHGDFGDDDIGEDPIVALAKQF